MSSEKPPRSDQTLVDRVENPVLALAIETENALYEAIWSLRGDYPDLSEVGLVALARPAMHRLFVDGLVEIYWHSQREPASAQEDQQVRAELERRFRNLGSTQSVTGPVGVPVETPMTSAQVQDSLADDARWRPPEGADGRPWFETPHVYFVATESGRRAYQSRRSEAKAELLPAHESGVRRMVADAQGQPYSALRSLGEAQAAPDGVVVLEGDYGGQIYLTCPARLVKCDLDTLEQLLADLDGMAWRDSDGARVFFEHQPIGAGVTGGMGGGRVTDGVWLHPNLLALRIEHGVREVIEGKRPRLARTPGPVS